MSIVSAEEPALGMADQVAVPADTSMHSKRVLAKTEWIEQMLVSEPEAVQICLRVGMNPDVTACYRPRSDRT